MEQQNARSIATNGTLQPLSNANGNHTTAGKHIPDVVSPNSAISSDTSLSSFEDEREDGKPPACARIAVKKSRSQKRSSLLGHIVRFVVLDVWVWLSVIAVAVVLVMNQLKTEYLPKQMQLLYWSEDKSYNEFTYMNRYCTEDDVTASEPADILIHPNDTAAVCHEKMLKHGASIYPNLLKPSTAKAVRNFILNENKQSKDMIYVIENENRFSFRVQVDQHPSVAQALTEVFSNRQLVDAIEAIAGPDPAVIEFTGITSSYGAVSQDMHQDVVPSGSSGKFGRNFVPSYSLFIPLQDTTAEMGATDICPGSHLCTENVMEMCTEMAFSASGPQNKWPTGWGALVNQQTGHRGPAHHHRGAMDRVLFILTFAPRPRYGHHEVETRILGSGGSYSLHWSQWGHTLSDYADANKHMAFPWRHLRALGLYKHSNRKWGWDFPAVTIQRIIHEELGYTSDDFTSAWKDGSFDWIPKIFTDDLGTLDELLEEVYDNQGNTISPWVTFGFGVFANVLNFIKKLHVVVLATYFAVMFALNLFRSNSGNHWAFRKSTLRVLWAHAVVALAAWLFLRGVNEGSLARNISRNFAYSSEIDYSLFNRVQPATLPTIDDILVMEDLQSPYLPSVRRVADHASPGNDFWFREVQTAAANYEIWSSNLQLHLCDELLDRALERGSRMLVKNDRNEWSPLSRSDAQRTCHKDLTKLSQPTVGHVLQWIDFLKSEVKFGYWRGSKSLNVNAFRQLLKLEERILRFKKHPDPKRPIGPWGSYNSSDIHGALRVRSYVAKVPLVVRDFKSSRSSFPHRAFKGEPFPGAWLVEGEVVEGKYQSTFPEYYRGTIVSLTGHMETWDVEYDDGELDEGLCRVCVRPFHPYFVGEDIEFKSQPDFFEGCTVVEVNLDGSYDVQLLSSGKIVRGVTNEELRRTDSEDWGNLFPGRRVETLYPGEDSGDTYYGTIGRVLEDGLYLIYFDDGDVAEIEGSMIVAVF